MEYLDTVNEKDEVTGKISINNLYMLNPNHRIVHVLIFNKNGDMALQLRSKTKSFCPSHWSTAVGGHVQSGETYNQAALREFKEELGANSQITELFSSTYEYKSGSVKFIKVFSTIYEGPFTLNPEEVEQIKFFSKQEIREMISNGDKFHPELLAILKDYLRI